MMVGWVERGDWPVSGTKPGRNLRGRLSTETRQCVWVEMWAMGLMIIIDEIGS